MAAEEIPDWQISATSTMDPHIVHPTNGRLNHRFGWCANPDDELKSLQVDLGNLTTITGLVTQGLSQASEFVYIKKFLLSFSNDNLTWWNEEEPVGVTKIYECYDCNVEDFNNDFKITYNLLKPIKARFLKFSIIDFEESPCVRIEILGCRGEVSCGSNYNSPIGTITSPNHPYYYGQDKSCRWTISPPSNETHVFLKFYLVELAQKEAEQLAGNCSDSLTIESGNGLMTIRSKEKKKFPRYIVSNGTLQIKLQSCFRSTITRRRGFYANYSFV
uniref:CUB domain-containing protein n=1 Tax=Strigamia maritima TaxID=126957 RepID=T1JKL9_STRMM